MELNKISPQHSLLYPTNVMLIKQIGKKKLDRSRNNGNWRGTYYWAITAGFL